MIRAADGRFIADCGFGPATTERIQDAKANAELIVRAVNSHAELLSTLQRSYDLLADIRHNWTGRETFAGQALLCAMRDTIAKATDRDPCEVSTGNRSEILDAL
ncbi:MAG TPA: hypothetical protein VHS96_18390 [Bacteroidia bacterium]|nr:hypothetical protein [Bacteroidia bacterium]